MYAVVPNLSAQYMHCEDGDDGCDEGGGDAGEVSGGYGGGNYNQL